LLSKFKEARASGPLRAACSNFIADLPPAGNQGKKMGNN
jgi:hypothetical protein